MNFVANGFDCDLWLSFLMVPKNNKVSLLRYGLSCEIANQAKLFQAAEKEFVHVLSFKGGLTVALNPF